MSDPLSDMSTERAAEYLAQLQSHIDALSAKDAAQRNRIRKLEADRETLRARLEAARGRRNGASDDPIKIPQPTNARLSPTPTTRRRLPPGDRCA